MKNFKRILSILVTLKRMASVFLLLTLLIVGLSAQTQRKGSAQRPRASGPGVNNSRLAGTYRLNTARSDNPSATVYGATNSLPEEDQLLILGGLMSRLESPDVLVIEQRGQAVTISPSNAPGVTSSSASTKSAPVVQVAIRCASCAASRAESITRAAMPRSAMRRASC